jgi:hypothetical protein
MNSHRTLGSHLSIAIALAAALCGAPLTAATFQFTVIDNPGVGFNDPTPVAPIAGNTATTLGAQRLAALRAGAAAWEAILPGDRVIRVETYHASLECGSNFGVLGRGGATTQVRDFPNAPLLDTWYPPALADELAGEDQDPAGLDLRIFFNINVDQAAGCLGGQGFWYGTQGSPPAGRASFRDVTRHELAHGLGFNTLVDDASGAKAQGRDDIFMVFLEHHGLGAWPNLSDAQRVQSTRSPGDLHWVGQNVVDAAFAELDAGFDGSSGHVEMAASASPDESSAVHWSADLSPDELMEPAATRTPSDALTRRAIADLGYTARVGDTGACAGGDGALCLGAGGRFEVETWYTDASGERKPGHAIPFTRDSGLFYFFGQGNIELLVKVLDACVLNGRRWVFYAATTDVEFGLRVRDTVTGAVKSYQSRSGQPAQTITDSGAFANCPGSAAVAAPDGALVRVLEELEATTAKRSVRGAGALADATSSTGAESFEAAAGDRVPPAGAPRRASSAAVASILGLEGSPFAMAAGLTGDIDRDGFLDFEELVLLDGGAGVDVKFDGVEEPVAPYGFGLGTVTRVDEEVRDLGNGRLQLVLTLRAPNGAELFPAGVSVGGVELTGVLVALGTRAAGDALDFLNLGVASSRIQMFRGQQRLIDSALPVGSFFPDRPWDGDTAVVFPGQAGKGIDRVELTIDVDVPIYDAAPVAPFKCAADGQTLCLANGRFEVTIAWRDFQGNTGAGEMVPIPGSGDSGLSYFFEADNLEVLIKVLDARVINGRFWVFYAATTSVELEIRVTDSVTGKVRVYLNELGRTASAIADTAAF